MDVWNGIWKKIIVWNGRLLVWNENGMEENSQYGMWKNRLPFHFIPCPASHIISILSSKIKVRSIRMRKPESVRRISFVIEL